MCKTDFGLICGIKSHFPIHNTVHNYCTQKIEILIGSLPSNLLGVKNCLSLLRSIARFPTFSSRLDKSIPNIYFKIS